MTRSWPQRALLVLGLLLVTVPLYAPALDVTGTDYHYEATEITAEDNELTFVDDRPRRLYYGLSGFDCYGTPADRSCALEAATLDGPVVAPHPTITEATGADFLDTDEPYLAYGDGRVYDYTAEWNGSERAFVLGVERVNAVEALDQVATPARHAPTPALNAVRTGTATTDGPLWGDDSREAHIVEYEGDYYVVSVQFYSPSLSENPLLERLLEGISVAFGLAVLARVRSEQ
ncbi:hypothetical protein SAMN04487949_0793 [Halogranum gelatinilyticum]|uniref:Uncharacterized protein n=1 Tax=Halogranum gelatinilyticum TaxID=660521 RepID=A0A1G9QC89_9EURY|nr:hypothetical protein [Halogranum gelatinilyticum]SDM08684.1 hypothetical protein SAMN04487949_0793 [Halogranum gelatinilyticum]